MYRSGCGIEGFGVPRRRASSRGTWRTPSWLSTPSAGCNRRGPTRRPGPPRCVGALSARARLTVRVLFSTLVVQKSMRLKYEPASEPRCVGALSARAGSTVRVSVFSFWGSRSPNLQVGACAGLGLGSGFWEGVGCKVREGFRDAGRPGPPRCVGAQSAHARFPIRVWSVGVDVRVRNLPRVLGFGVPGVGFRTNLPVSTHKALGFGVQGSGCKVGVCRPASRS